MIVTASVAYGYVRAEVESLRNETKDLGEIRKDMALLQQEVRAMALQIIELRRQSEAKAHFAEESYKLNKEALLLQRELLEKVERLIEMKKK